MKIDDCYNKAWYALRRTLPPWSWRENLAELAECSSEYGIDEIIVKVDTEEFSHHIPAIEWLVNYQPVLLKIKETIEDIGVVFSINPWVTLVHADRGRNCKAKFPDINFMVGHDGTQCIDCACPLSQGWRRHTAELWKIYAETHPDTIWVEDDIRTFHHPPVQYGCFCDEHLKKFSESAGEKLTRKKLVSCILKSGEPHPYRRKWLKMQSEIMVDAAGILEKAVHSVSPEIRIGLMSSGPDNHCLEGRDWHSFIKSLTGPRSPAPSSRPPLGNYREGHLKGLYYTANSLRRTRYALPSNIIELAEIENIPFTQYNKSTTFTFLQAAVCFSMGAHGVTMNLFDHCGTPMKDDIEILESLKDAKGYLHEICKKSSSKGKFSGVRIVHHDEASYCKKLGEGADYGDLLPDSYGWENILQPLGFGTTYEPSHIVALTGQTIRCFGRDEIISMLGRGVLCDLSAALTLQDMGYGEYLGVTVKRSFRCDSESISGEHFFNPDFGGKKRKYFSLTISPGQNLIGELALHPGAIGVSEIVNPDAERLYPGFTLYENMLKGRIAVYPVNMNQAGFEFLRPARQIQMQKILGWLSHDSIPLFVSGGHNTLPFRIDYESHSVIGVFCLSLDAWKTIDIIASLPDKKVSKVEVLHNEPQWQAFENFRQEGGKLYISYSKPVTFQKPVIFSVEWDF